MNWHKQTWIDTNRHEQTRTDMNRHGQAQTDANRHQQTPTDTNRHQQTPTDTARHGQTRTDTDRDGKTQTDIQTSRSTGQISTFTRQSIFHEFHPVRADTLVATHSVHTRTIRTRILLALINICHKNELVISPSSSYITLCSPGYKNIIFQTHPTPPHPLPQTPNPSYKPTIWLVYLWHVTSLSCLVSQVWLVCPARPDKLDKPVELTGLDKADSLVTADRPDWYYPAPAEMPKSSWKRTKTSDSYPCRLQKSSDRYESHQSSHTRTCQGGWYMYHCHRDQHWSDIRRYLCQKNVNVNINLLGSVSMLFLWFWSDYSESTNQHSLFPSHLTHILVYSRNWSFLAHSHSVHSDTGLPRDIRWYLWW